MSTESLNRTSSIEISENQDPVKVTKIAPRRANMDVLRKRLLQEKKKRKEKDDINSFYSCSFSWSNNYLNLLIL